MQTIPLQIDGQEMVRLTIDGRVVSVPRGFTVMRAAHRAGITIPSLCFLKHFNPIGACRICVVEVKGAKTLVASCVHPVENGMEVFTNTPRVRAARKKTLQLMVSNHDRKCLSCARSGSCELQRLCREYHVEDEEFYAGDRTPSVPDKNPDGIILRDNSKCILCRRCVAICNSIQGIGAIGVEYRGFNTQIGSAFGRSLGESTCVNCGQCIIACPTGALTAKDSTEQVGDLLHDPTKHVIVQTAPAVRAALGECFNMPIGTDVQGKMVTALRLLGFDQVFDTNFAADLTIMEEAHELIDRIQNGGKLPLITSCSAGWVKYCEHYFPDFLDNLSSCKSPQQMFGAIAKSYYAEKMGLDPKDIVVVSVMPCTAKKFENNRPDQCGTGYPDVDYVLTTRELGRMIHEAGIRFTELPDDAFDAPLGISTGAGVLFGNMGGVMEAALRTAVEVITGQELGILNFNEVRGIKGIREAAYKVGNLELRVAVASGLANARELLEKVRRGEAHYDFIEVMACPGGCVNGGGQPQQPPIVWNFKSVRIERAKVLYARDENSTIRKSHENPAIQELYRDYLEEPGSELAHKLLHTTYQVRDAD